MTTTSDVPGVYDVGIDGRGYMVDTQYLEAFRYQTIDPIRRQADASESVGESSLNPEGYWRRSPESWHRGAGQARYDATDSDPERFGESSGIDVWTEGQLSMLREMSAVLATPTLVGSTLYEAIESGGRLYGIEGPSTVFYEYNINTSAITEISTTNSDIDALTTDGDYIYWADGGHLYYTTQNDFTDGSVTATAWISGDPTNIADVIFVGNRLLCLDTSGNIYDVTASGLSSLPTALFNPPGLTLGSLQAVATGGYIYFSTPYVSGYRAAIYKTTLNDAGTALEVPTIAAELPDGETIFRLYAYLGFVLILGGEFGGGNYCRFALADANGDLTLGETFLEDYIIGGPFVSRVGWAAAQGQYIYLAGMANVNAVSTKRGIIRLDPSIINDALVPAYAFDVESTLATRWPVFIWVSNNVLHMLMDDGTLTRSGSAEDYVSTGKLVQGEISHGTREPKLFLDPVETASDGTVSHRLTTPSGSVFTDQNLTSTEPSVTWRMDLTTTVSGDDMTMQYPILRALPAPAQVERVTVPLLLHNPIELRTGGQTATVDIPTELAALRTLRDNGTLVDFQDGAQTRTAQVIAVSWQPLERDLDGTHWQGTCLVTLKII